MKTSDFDYDLPPELIAQEPAAERDGCRLLVMDRATGALEDRIFRDIADYLRPGDVLALCGKGHEDYQVIDGVTLYLDEHRIVREWLERKGLNKA